MEKKKKFNLFDMNRDGKGVEKKEDGPKNFKNFFKFFGRKFSRLLSLNLIMIFMVLPLIISVMVYIVGPTTQSSGNVLFPTLYGAAFMTDSPAMDIVSTLYSVPMAVPVYNSYVYYIIAAFVLFLVLTFGWQNVGSIYILRNMVRGDAVFLVSDYFYAIKKNKRQGFLMGLLDCLAAFILAVDFMFFSAQAGSSMMDIMYGIVVALVLIYMIMRTYIYLQIVTFNLSLWKIIKNAFIFTALGIKRNFVAFLGLVVIVVVNGALILWLAPLNIILPLVLPLFYFLATSGFIMVYAAYPVIEKYMIEPDLNPITDENSVDAEE